MEKIKTGTYVRMKNKCAVRRGVIDQAGEKTEEQIGHTIQFPYRPWRRAIVIGKKIEMVLYFFFEQVSKCVDLAFHLARESKFITPLDS